LLIELVIASSARAAAAGLEHRAGRGGGGNAAVA
jgi:hypothetical protein